MEDRFFPTKRHEEMFKPLFFQMRQIADRPTIRLLAHNIGKMEKLRDQLDELLELQKSGVKDLQGFILFNFFAYQFVY